MDLIIQKNLISLFKQIIDPTSKTNPIIPQTGGKFNPLELCNDTPSYFQKSIPEKVGIDSKILLNYVSELISDDSVFAHTVTILKDGKSILKTAIAPYDYNTPHVTYSLCKSITSLAIGLLYDENKISLNTKLIEIFKDELPAVANILHSKLTIKHLLNMTSGVFINETAAILDKNWKKSFLESARKTDAGEKFEYNSMNSYMLSAVVKKITGVGLCEYLDDKIFSKMGITKYFWEKSPEGIEKGGFGMYMLPEDMAKIGQLYLQRGLWEGVQLISAKWFDSACAVNAEVPDNISEFDYGYHVWVRKSPYTIILNGMFGQNVLVYPDKNIVVAITAGNSDMFHINNFFNITDKYFSDIDTKPKSYNPKNFTILEKYLEEKENIPFVPKSTFKNLVNNLFKSCAERKFINKCSTLFKNNLVFDNNKTGGINILPLALQIVQNNYTHGINSISFSFMNNTFFCSLTQGEETYTFPVNRAEYHYDYYRFNDEIYRCAVRTILTQNEDGIDVLVIRIYFLETASVRTIKIFFENSKTRVIFIETPGKEFIFDSAELFTGALKPNKILEHFSTDNNLEIIRKLIAHISEPEISVTHRRRE